MARWKLVNAHHLNCDAEWEYQEIDRTTGKQVRKRFPVPRFLNPFDPQDWNYHWGNKDNEDGEIIVCYEGKGEPKDIIFRGDPTPDMVPQDDEAKVISASFEKRWSYKPETDVPGGYSQSMIDKFQHEMAESRSKPAEIPGLSDLVTAITKQSENIAKLVESNLRRI
jgi:hypothetical protein